MWGQIEEKERWNAVSPLTAETNLLPSDDGAWSLELNAELNNINHSNCQSVSDWFPTNAFLSSNLQRAYLRISKAKTIQAKFYNKSLPKYLYYSIGFVSLMISCWYTHRFQLMNRIHHTNPLHITLSFDWKFFIFLVLMKGKVVFFCFK